MGGKMAFSWVPRWLAAEDFADAAAIDRDSGAWDPEAFAEAFADPAVHGIAFHGGRQSITLRECFLAAWVVYRFDREAVRILRICVFKDFRRRGVADLLLRYAMANRIDFKAHRGYRFCSASVQDSDESGQILFRRFGLTCVGHDSSGWRFAGLV